MAGDPFQFPYSGIPSVIPLHFENTAGIRMVDGWKHFTKVATFADNIELAMEIFWNK